MLNLWQKNNVFAPDVIQPLFDLANPDHPVHVAFKQSQQNELTNGMNTSRDSPPNHMQDDHQNNDSVYKDKPFLINQWLNKIIFIAVHCSEYPKIPTVSTNALEPIQC